MAPFRTRAATATLTTEIILAPAWIKSCKINDYWSTCICRIPQTHLSQSLSAALSLSLLIHDKNIATQLGCCFTHAYKPATHIGRRSDGFMLALRYTTLIMLSSCPLWSPFYPRGGELLRLGFDARDRAPLQSSHPSVFLAQIHYVTYLQWEKEQIFGGVKYL